MQWQTICTSTTKSKALHDKNHRANGHFHISPNNSYHLTDFSIDDCGLFGLFFEKSSPNRQPMRFIQRDWIDWQRHCTHAHKSVSLSIHFAIDFFLSFFLSFGAVANLLLLLWYNFGLKQTLNYESKRVADSIEITNKANKVCVRFSLCECFSFYI